MSALVGDAEDGFALYRLGCFFICIIPVSTKNGFAYIEINLRSISHVINIRCNAYCSYI